MCFNKESSIISYTLGSICSLILFYIGDKYDKCIAIFSLCFIQIQLAEFFMWSDQSCGKINHFASIYANIILFLQPLSLLLVILFYKTTYIPQNIIYFCLVLVSIPLIKTIINNIINKRQLCSKETKSGYLEWDFPNDKNSYFPNDKNSILEKIIGLIIYFILVFIPWLFFKNHFKGNLVFFIELAILFYSFFTNKNNKINILQQWESKWCILSVIIPIIFLFIKIPFVKKLISQI